MLPIQHQRRQQRQLARLVAKHLGPTYKTRMFTQYPVEVLTQMLTPHTKPAT